MKSLNCLKFLFVYYILWLFSYAATAQDSSRFTFVTDEFARVFNISNFIITTDSFGSYGTFGSDSGKLQMAFTEAKVNPENEKEYLVKGYSRHRKQVTPFTGKLIISEIKLYKGDVDFAYDSSAKPIEYRPKFVSYTGTFQLDEEKNSPYSGVFTGRWQADFHQLHDKKPLEVNAKEVQKAHYRNFYFAGEWKAYNGKFGAPVSWQKSKLPAAAHNKKYVKNGWQRDKNGNLTDNPALWWK